MSNVKIIYKEYDSIRELSSSMKSEINSMVQGGLTPTLEGEINKFVSDNEDKTIKAILGYGGSKDESICFDLKEGTDELESWVLGDIKKFSLGR